MDIILDSNVFRGDLLLRSSDFEVIYDYLRKTGSNIVLPQIILDEVKGLYRRILNERESKLNGAIKNYNLAITDPLARIKFEPLDISKELEKFETYVIEKLNVRKDKIIPVNNDYLPEVIKRAIERTKPCGNSGQGFRDSIIWLTLKDYCMKCHEKQIIFISNNCKDFGDSSGHDLDQALMNECENLGIKINYFKTIREFIDKHSTKIEFITHDWLSERVDTELIADIILEGLNGKQSDRIVSWYSGETGNHCTGYFRARAIHPYNQDDLSIYEMADNSLIVNFTIGCEVEIEFEIYNNEFERQTKYEQLAFGSSPTSFDIKYLDCSAYFSATIIDKEVEDVELNDLAY